MIKKIICIISLFFFIIIHSSHAENNFNMEGDWPNWTAELIIETSMFNMLDGTDNINKKVNIISNEIGRRKIIAFNSDDFYIYGIINQISNYLSFCGYDDEYIGDQFEVLIQVDNKSYQGCATL